jgi:hypothetical protein
VSRGKEAAAIDSKSLLDPRPPLEHADRLLREADPSTAGAWARTAARLMRLALERAADRHWHQARPELMACNTTMKMLMLQAALGRAAARDALALWSRLSDATHPHPYELAPTAGELRRWHDEVTQFVGQLAAADGRAAEVNAE